jgi:hypothetical protein
MVATKCLTPDSPPVHVDAHQCGNVEININYHQHCGGDLDGVSMRTIKEMIDAVIATTEDVQEAARLELCRAYLFNPLLGNKIEQQIFSQIGKQAAPSKKRSRPTKG